MLALVVVVVGAYVRLSDAGLGCPDWPFCYGKPVPADIEPSVWPWMPTAAIAALSSSDSNHSSVSSTVDIDIERITRAADRNRIARLQRENSVHLPSADHVIHGRMYG